MRWRSGDTRARSPARPLRLFAGSPHPLRSADDAAAFGLPLQRAWFSETTRPDAKITKERLDDAEILEMAAERGGRIPGACGRRGVGHTLFP